MIEMDLKGLSKANLVEYIVKLSEENGVLKKEKEELEETLKNAKIEAEKMGSVAEVAASINKLMESADKTAEQYINNARMVEKEAEMNAEKLQEETRAKCSEMVEEAEKKVSDARVQCAAMVAAAKKSADDQWSELKNKLDRYCEAHDILREQLDNMNV